MPKYWKSKYGLKEEETDSDELKEHKQLLKRIAADRKPYFFIYNYDTLHAEYGRYLKKAHNAYMCEYGSDLLEDFELFKMDRDSWGIKRRTFFEYFDKFLPVDMSPCTMNRICWAIERQTKNMTISVNGDYDWHKLKSPHPEYSMHTYYKVKPILAKEYDKFQDRMRELNILMKAEYIHGMESVDMLQTSVDMFLRKLNLICPDEELKCDILLEVAYKNNKSKKFVWELCGNQMVKNLLIRHGNRVSYPVIADINSDFEYCGIGYSMVTDIVDTEVYDEQIF